MKTLKRKRKCNAMCAATTIQRYSVDADGKPIWICECCGAQTERIIKPGNKDLDKLFEELAKEK